MKRVLMLILAAVSLVNTPAMAEYGIYDHAIGPVQPLPYSPQPGVFVSGGLGGSPLVYRSVTRIRTRVTINSQFGIGNPCFRNGFPMGCNGGFCPGYMPCRGHRGCWGGCRGGGYGLGTVLGVGAIGLGVGLLAGGLFGGRSGC